jgi:hypothetical protein
MPQPRRDNGIMNQQHLILFLAASPRNCGHLELANECAEIQRELDRTIGRHNFRLESRSATTVDELMRHLTELDPAVIHFSGDSGANAGLLLQNEQGQLQPVSPRALAMMINVATRNTRVVVLNACHSSVQADVLRGAVDFVIELPSAIRDSAARTFAVRFYGAIASHRSVGNAVAQGIAALAAKQLPDEALPRCITRHGIDAEAIVLATQPVRTAATSSSLRSAGARSASRRGGSDRSVRDRNGKQPTRAPRRRSSVIGDEEP